MPEARSGPPAVASTSASASASASASVPMPAAAPGLWAEARAYATLAGPMVVSRLGVAGFGLADGLMLARHSAEQLAVNGLAESVMGRVLEVAMMVATAGLALVAQARAGGSATARGVGVAWHNAVALALLLGAVGVGVGLAGGTLLKALGQPAVLLPDAGRVLAILGASAAPALLGLVCAGVLEALGRPVAVAVAVVLANLLNIALNQWFIHGGAGLPALGAEGAAWSTLLVRTGLAAALFAAMWWLPGRDTYALRGRFGPAQWREGTELRRRGAAGAANVGVLALLSMGLPVMAGWLGADAVAQVTALFLALTPAMVLAWGLGDAAGLRVAALQGAGSAGGGWASDAVTPAAQRDDARALVAHPGDARAHGTQQHDTRVSGTREEDRRMSDALQLRSAQHTASALRATGLRLAALLAIALAGAVALYAGAPRTAVSIAAHDPALVAAVVPLLPLGLVALVGDATSVFLAAMLRSLGVLRGPFLAHLGAGLLVLPLAWTLGFGLGWGLAGLIAAHGAAALLRAVALGWMFLRAAQAHDRPAATGAPAA